MQHPTPAGDPVKRAEEEFGQRVRQGREVLKLSQRALAARLGEYGVNIDPSAITRLERGERSVRLGEAYAISRALSLSLGSLLGEGIADHPGEGLRDSHRRAHTHMHNARESLVRMLTQLEAVHVVLRQRPDLADAFNALVDEAQPLAPGDDYLAWVRARMQRELSGWVKAPAATDEDARRLQEVVQALITDLVALDPTAFLIGDDDG